MKYLAHFALAAAITTGTPVVAQDCTDDLPPPLPENVLTITRLMYCMPAYESGASKAYTAACDAFAEALEKCPKKDGITLYDDCRGELNRTFADVLRATKPTLDTLTGKRPNKDPSPELSCKPQS